MLEIANLRGCGTAIVTPFREDQSVDEEALSRFVEFQISEGIDFLVPCGTTGESATLSDEEQCRVVEIVASSGARARSRRCGRGRQQHGSRHRACARV